MKTKDETFHLCNIHLERGPVGRLWSGSNATREATVGKTNSEKE